jgi:transcription elongation factor Elf1
MKFACLGCGEKEFSINLQDLRNEEVALQVVCPNCETINRFQVSNYDDELKVNIVEKSE